MDKLECLAKLKDYEEIVAEKDRLIENLCREIDQRNYPCGNALTKVWDVTARDKYGDWEYPAQAARLIIESISAPTGPRRLTEEERALLEPEDD